VFRVWGVGYGVWSLGVRDWSVEVAAVVGHQMAVHLLAGLAVGGWGLGLGFRVVWDFLFGVGVWGLGLKVSGLRFGGKVGVLGLGHLLAGLEFGGWELG